jgi:hypothetical protein
MQKKCDGVDHPLRAGDQYLFSTAQTATFRYEFSGHSKRCREIASTLFADTHADTNDAAERIITAWLAPLPPPVPGVA